jgi:predicted nucleotide-binding protein
MGQGILQGTECQHRLDFAVVILARDDVMVRETGDTLKAHDNGVLEAGLFMKVIGRERCFLVSSVERHDFPEG